ncbi:TMEM165/GDT1 family protein [Candidatus Woesearchaeota archaeon]|nr:TMEM165/GDT1 family protein [Candidatus Woesearchaeota archaeon]
MLQDFLIPFATIALAEIGDKTQLAMMAMAARYKHTMQIFLGAMAASAIVDGSAVALGNYASKYVPKAPVSIAAGVLFVVFGIYTLLRKEENESAKAKGMTKRSVLIAAFILFFFSEFGDKSQFAALLFGTQYNLLLALLGALSGIAVVLAVMLHIGKFVSKHLDEKATRLLSALLFIGVGLFTLMRALGSA